MNTMEKLAEPRGWSLEWESLALLDREARLPENGHGRGRGGRVWQDPEPSAPDRTWAPGFSEPRAWALQWDGLALVQTEAGAG
jgi:hypothetical protein